MYNITLYIFQMGLLALHYTGLVTMGIWNVLRSCANMALMSMLGTVTKTRPFFWELAGGIWISSGMLDCEQDTPLFLGAGRGHLDIVR